MTDELAFLDATACATLVAGGEISPAEMVEAAINRIEKVDPEIEALVSIRFDRARLRVAAQLEAARPWARRRPPIRA